MKSEKWLLWMACAILLLGGLCLPALADQAWTDLVVLSTTDMHGKCWETDILTCGENGGLTLTEAPDGEALSLWRLIPMDGGYGLLRFHPVKPESGHLASNTFARPSP